MRAFSDDFFTGLCYLYPRRSWLLKWKGCPASSIFAPAPTLLNNRSSIN
uniref:Uncharacterized protein n=1 Tax=Picea glauca TaxID=3330 RepID=A0A124GMP7_PICGL|nr:hypothetical protein ABT39_MTgene1829 [Picea glauca]